MWVSCKNLNEQWWYSIFGKLKNMKWRWLFHPPTPDKKKRFFRPPRASNGLMIKPFELGGLQMILSEPPMSNSSGGTHMDHASRRKFSFLKKMCKKLSYFLKQKIAVIQTKSFCVQTNFKNTRIFYYWTAKVPNFVSFSRAIYYSSLIF